MFELERSVNESKERRKKETFEFVMLLAIRGGNNCKL